MKALCNNPSCKQALSKKVFEVDDLGSSCPSCGASMLLPESAAKYVDSKGHHRSKRLNESKDKVKAKLGARHISSNPELKKIEFSYSKKMAELEKALKNSKLMKKFKDIDEHLDEGELDLKKIKYELDKLDGLFKKYHGTSSKTKKTTKKGASKKAKK